MAPARTSIAATITHGSADDESSDTGWVVIGPPAESGSVLSLGLAEAEAEGEDDGETDGDGVEESVAPYSGPATLSPAIARSSVIGTPVVVPSPVRPEEAPSRTAM